MKKILKLTFYIILLLLVLSPVFVQDSGISQEEYASKFEIEGGEFLEVDGYKTYYIDINSDFEKTILLIHGFGGSATNWLPVIPSISEDYRVVAVDLKGFGFSEKKRDEDFSHPSQVKFLNSFVEELNLEKFSIVGHSMGGNIATMYTQEYPEKIEKLVLVSAAVLTKEEVDILRSNALKVLDWPILREYVRVFLKFGFNESRVKRVFNSAMHKEVEVDEPFFVNPTIFEGWEYVAIKMTSVVNENTLSKPLGDMEVPVSIIWGAEDTWVPLSKGKSLNESIEGSELNVLEDVNHLPMFEDPEGFSIQLKKSLQDS